MLQCIVLVLVTFLSCLHVTNTLYEHKGGGEYPEALQPSLGVEYNEYPEFESKLHHTSRDLGWGGSPQGNLVPHGQVFTAASNSIPHSNKEVDESEDTSKLKLIPNWPDVSKKLGQLSAVSIDADGNVVVFHRGDRIWRSQTFRYDNVYNERNLGPIQQNTVVVFNATSGLVVEEWGSNIFYLPHGLTVDSENNVWVTDVALHQVFKFPAKRSSPSQPSLSLGTPFIPGNDDKHFCKPTDVAILSNGDFFVSDGYCNSRIIKFDKNGNHLMVWGRSTFPVLLGTKPPPNHFLVPHALALAEEKEMMFVADRENGRIQCFNTSSGTFIMQLQSYLMGTRIFSVAYTPVQGGLLYIVNGPGIQDQKIHVGGFVVSLATRQLVAQFNSNGLGFQNPHDVAVSTDGSQVYAVELDPYKVWKFVQGNLNQSIPVKTVNEDALIPAKANGTGSIQITPLKSDTSKFSAKNVEGHVTMNNGGSVTIAVGVIAGVVAAVIIVIAIAVIRIRRGVSKKYRELSMDYD